MGAQHGSRLSVDEWRSWLRQSARPTAVETIDVAAAHGRFLAEDVRSAHPMPLWDNSAMDGYAVRAGDIVAAAPDAPVELRVICEVAAGSDADPGIQPGHAVRIMTGAAVPSDADAVVPVEKTTGDRGDEAEGPAWADRTVLVREPVAVGANVRVAGEDTAVGGPIADRGRRLTAARVSAIAAAGVARVAVRRVPRVAVLVTGSELCAPGIEPRRGQVPESNSALIAGMLREAGVEAVSVRHTRDDARGLRRHLDALAVSCDAIVTTGGVGPGTHDVVRIALEGERAIRGVRVAVRPGQPQRAGPLGDAFVFALPGNPVSAAASFELFVRPTLLAMQGASRTERPRIPAVAATGWRGAAGRLQVLPVRVAETDDGLSCVPAVNPRGVSHAVGGHGGADGYALVEEDRGDVVTGETVRVILVAQ